MKIYFLFSISLAVSLRYVASVHSCANFIECKMGIDIASGESCHQACAAAGGNCCTSLNDCDGFTGKVCADAGQYSCSTDSTNPNADGFACRRATISEVIDGCRDITAETDSAVGIVPPLAIGEHVCEDAQISKVHGGCKGSLACLIAGNHNCCLGVVDESCFGTSACHDAAYSDGSIDVIFRSCFGDGSCFGLARGGSSIKSVTYSCLGDGTCQEALADALDGNFHVVDFFNGSCNGLLYVCHGFNNNIWPDPRVSKTCSSTSNDGDYTDLSSSCHNAAGEEVSCSAGNCATKAYGNEHTCSSPPADPCSTTPCLNSGVCVATADSFSCLCDPRYTGTICEHVNLCSPNPCLNGGSCIDNIFGTCLCPNTHEGEICQTVSALSMY